MSPVQQGSRACPSREELLAFSEGRLLEWAWEVVDTHLATSCPRCEAALLELADRDDPLSADLAAASPLSSADAEEACRWVLDRVGAAGPAPSSTTTDDYAGSRGSPVSPLTPAASARQPIEFVCVFGPGGMPGGNLQTLLRRRLKSATTLVAGFYALLLIKWATFYDGYAQVGQYGFRGWTSFLVDHAAFVGEVIAACFLWSSKSLSLPRLRRIELVVLGLPLLDQSVLEWHRLFLDHQLLGLQTQTEAIVSGRYDVLAWFALIIGYGVFIPNTWQRCSAIVAAIAGIALAVNLVAAGADGVAFHSAVLLRLVEIVLWLAFAIAFAVYNSYRIEVLSKEVIRLGQYRLLQRLDGGGMGEVYRAEHALLRRPCAIKLIRPERANDPDSRRRFEQEAQKMAALTHPNTIVIYDYGHAADGRFYYAMEYLEGMNMAELVRKHGPLPPARAIFLLRQVCSALREAHELKLIHRDIKPGNVIVGERGGLHDMAKLLDFGLVQTHGLCAGGRKLTGEGTFVGTPAYTSPEQAAMGERGEIDCRSDLYSLGATAYFLLTGRPVFVRNTVVQTLNAHLEDMPDPPDGHRADVPADLQAVVLRCLEKDPAQRFQSAEDLEEALAGCACAGHWDRAKAAAWSREHAKACQMVRNDT